MKTRAGMKIRRRDLGLLWVQVPDETLQDAYDTLVDIRMGGNRVGHKMKTDVFFSLTEELLEHYGPKYDGGLEWDNRRGLLK